MRSKAQVLNVIKMVRLPYGESYLTIRFSGKRVTVFSPRKVKPVAHASDYAYQSVHEYFVKDRHFFSRFADRRICVVVSDNTRYTLNHVIVPLVLNELVSVGVRRDNITILIANGLHARMSRRAQIENLGRKVVADFKVKNHDASGELVHIGRTKRRTPLYINSDYVKSELKIATGLVAPHFHAGFGGGCKSIVPGISGRNTILKNHNYRMVEHPKARYGITTGNPIYEDILDGGLRSGLNLIVNIAVDSKLKLTHVFIGKPKPTHRQAVQQLTHDLMVEFEEPYDIVVTTNGGFPLDRNLYQCVKGVAIGEIMVKKGGTIIVAAECRDGVGHRVFQRYMTHGLTPRDVLTKLKEDEPVDDQDNVQILARALEHSRVIIVTNGLRPHTIRSMKMEYAPSIDAALRLCGNWKTEKTKIAVVPGGPYVLPVRTK